MSTAAASLLEPLRWPTARLGDALEALATHAGLTVTPDALPPLPRALSDDPPAGGALTDDLGRWLDWAGARLGLEVEALDTPALDTEALLQRAGPAVWQVKDAAGSGVLVLLAPSRGRVRLIGPDLRVHHLRPRALRDALCRRFESPHEDDVTRLLHTAGVPARRQAGVRRAMLRERLADHRIGRCWMLRLPPDAGLAPQLRQARLPRRLLAAVGVFSVLYGAELTAWSLMGRSTLNGEADAGWLGAWALLMLSMIPLRLLGGWLDARIALDLGRMLKTRLLSGALAADADQVKQQGAGRLLARVMESQALETLALNGGFSAAVALLELLFAAWTLAAGAAGNLHLALLAVWLGLTVAGSLHFHRRMRRWTQTRLDMTHDLTEHMIGHRTRLAQEWASRRQAQEDQAMRRFAQESAALDRSLLPLVAVGPRGWLLLGLLGLAPAFVDGARPVDLAIALGGLLLAQRALAGLASGLASVSRAAIAWEQVATLFQAPAADAVPARFRLSGRTSSSGPSGPSGLVGQRAAADDVPSAAGATAQPAARPLVEASRVQFRHAGRDADPPVLQDVDLELRRGDRVLIEGESGGGKSTLAALLVGLRAPSSGVMLLDGLDRPTLGTDWRRLATAAPQFHDNHVLGGPLAFNLLMGRGWPPAPEDLQEARGLCDALGLGPLIDRMPAGLMQQVGETGWQLSHGERSRLFLARALLQRAELTVLDESFAALDPETLAPCLRCAVEHTRTLVVVGHP